MKKMRRVSLRDGTTRSLAGAPIDRPTHTGYARARLAGGSVVITFTLMAGFRATTLPRMPARWDPVDPLRGFIKV